MSNKTLNEIVTAPDKRVGETTNILARLWRIVLKDLKVDYNSLSTGINRFMNAQQKQVPRSQKEQSRERGNLVKELTGNALTWKNFVKGLMILNPIRIEIELRLFWRRGETTVHTVEIIPRAQDLDSEEEE